MSAATIRVRVPSGTLRTFEAEDATVEHGLVTATGRWSHHRGRSHRYTWPRDRVLEIRWTGVARAA